MIECFRCHNEFEYRELDFIKGKFYCLMCKKKLKRKRKLRSGEVEVVIRYRQSLGQKTWLDRLEAKLDVVVPYLLAFVFGCFFGLFWSLIQEVSK